MTTKAKPDSTETKKRILIVDDHPVVVWGLQLLINGQPDLTVCGDAADAGPALTLAEQLKPDLVIVDLKLKNSHGLELIKNLHARLPALPVLVLSMYAEELCAERCRRAGARGYLNKQGDGAAIVRAVEQILAGQMWVGAAGVNGQRSKLHRLSDREYEIFELRGEGRTSDGIAAVLGIAEHTVHNQYGLIRQKLELEDMRELDRLALRWVEEDHPLRETK